ncbi:MAG: LytTR family DNA-binding domain-containing protein [Tannerella sp.]|jgi:DNA-binding LytR/AlgR family response regulator|nr:LytTR family DNA-binding domain-containing protein [Tannerella sp.]
MNNMQNVLTVLIVDDEFHARKLLADYVSKIPFLRLAATCPNVFEAMGVMQKEHIDLLILDILMPGMTGIDFARSLNKSPVVIFSTAYSEYAVESYELEVADYLLKPVEFPRFLQAVYKAKSRTEAQSPAEEIRHPQTKREEDSFMIIKDGAKIYKIQYADLLYVEGQREYVTFHTTKQKITALYTLKNLEETLPITLFMRIHKSYIISVRHIESIDRNVLKIAGDTLFIGGNYREALMKRLNGGD